MEYKYVKPLSDIKLINEFETLTEYKFPDDYISFIKEYNGGRPDKKIFDTSTTKERAIKSFLSLNKEDRETIWKINEWSADVLDKKYVAIAIDNFGNLICFDKNSNAVVFIDTESNSVELIADSFSIFIECLY